MTAAKREQITVIIVGWGLIGPRHAEIVKNRKDTKLFAILDHHHGQDYAKKHNIPHYVSIKDMVNKIGNGVKPDAAIVCTPNATHVTMAVELAEQGIHLLVEKPLAINPQDSKALNEFAISRHVKLLVGHHRRFNPYILATKRHLASAGNIIAIQGTWALKKPDDYFSKPWRTESKLGGGPLLINLIHDIDLLQFLLGPVEKVYAELLPKQRAQFPNVDEGAVLTLRFQSGVAGTFLCSDNVTSPFNFECGTGENPTVPFHRDVSGFYRIFGSEGTISVPDMKLYHQESYTEQSWLKPIKTTSLIDNKSDLYGVPFDLQLGHFVDMILNDAEPSCSAVDGINALLTVEAVSRSIETGLPQYVEGYEDVVPNYHSLGF